MTALLQPLRTLQNKCLRRVARAYKHMPTAALERETATLPIDLHIDTLALQRSVRVADHPVTAEISRAADEVWKSLHRPAGELRPRRRGRPHRQRARHPDMGSEKLRKRARDREAEGRAHLERTREAACRHGRAPQLGGHAHRWRDTSLIARWTNLEWERRWSKQARGKTVTTGATPWTAKTMTLYEGLKKHEATALFLLRTEILGLNA